jgi:hypothetical protein
LVESTFEKVRFSLREYQEAYSATGLEPPQVPPQFQTSPTLKLTFNGELYYAFQFGGQTFHYGVPYGLPTPIFPIEYLPSYTPIDLGFQAKWLTTLKLKRREDLLLTTLRIIEPKLEDLELLYEGEPPLIFGYIGLPEPLPLIAMGEGMGRIASIILAIGNSSGGVVCIDEIENGLHYSVLADIWKAIYKAAIEFDVQIFATTLSLEAISAAHQAFLESESYDFRYHRLDRKEDGSIEAKTFDRAMLETAEVANFEVR